MPEANALYSVTAAVVVGLVAWVVFALKTAKEPWARSLPPRAADASEEGPAEVVEAGASADVEGAPAISPAAASASGSASGLAPASASRPEPASVTDEAPSRADVDAKT